MAPLFCGFWGLVLLVQPLLGTGKSRQGEARKSCEDSRAAGESCRGSEEGSALSLTGQNLGLAGHSSFSACAGTEAGRLPQR